MSSFIRRDGGNGVQGKDLVAGTASSSGSSVPMLAVGGAAAGAAIQSKSLQSSVKRVLDMMENAVSTMPAKIARYEATRISKKDDLLVADFQCHSDDISKRDEIEMPFVFRASERHTPLDVTAFNSRLQTFNLRVWGLKPEKISGFQCARFGWKIVGENLLECVSCHQLLAVPKGSVRCQTQADWSSKVLKSIVNLGHNKGCIWIKSPSPINIIALPAGKDMENYMNKVALSFNRMETLPVLTRHYETVMDTLDLTGLKNKTDMNLRCKLQGITQERIEEMSLFLMMNGWTMESISEDTLNCHLCFREVPLWNCKPAPCKVSIEELDFPPNEAENRMKEFDPVSNHSVWCPWRVFLQSVNPSVEAFLTNSSTNFLEWGSISSDMAKRATVDDYLKLASKIDKDYKSSRILIGSSFSINNPDAAIMTMFNVKNLLNSISGSNRGKWGSSEHSPCASDSDNNGIMILKAPQNVSRNLFITTATASEHQTRLEWMKLQTVEKDKEINSSIHELDDEPNGFCSTSPGRSNVDQYPPPTFATQESVTISKPTVNSKCLETITVVEQSKPTVDFSDLTQLEKAVVEKSKPTVDFSNLTQLEKAVVEKSKPTVDFSDLTQLEKEVVEQSKPTVDFSDLTQLEKEVVEQSKTTVDFSGLTQLEKVVVEQSKPTVDFSGLTQLEKAVVEQSKPTVDFSDLTQLEKEDEKSVGSSHVSNVEANTGMETELFNIKRTEIEMTPSMNQSQSTESSGNDKEYLKEADICKIDTPDHTKEVTNDSECAEEEEEELESDSKEDEEEEELESDSKVDEEEEESDSKEDEEDDSQESFDQTDSDDDIVCLN